jgi:hypothetical protein
VCQSRSAHRKKKLERFYCEYGLEWVVEGRQPGKLTILGSGRVTVFVKV